MTLITRTQWEEHYRSGPTPWDTRVTPPEVVAFWQGRPVPPDALALDIGCGTATNVAFLAGLGLRVIGFDLAGNALATGRMRILADQPQLLTRSQLVQADVTRLPLHQARAYYVLDIGCFHTLPFALRNAYVQGVINNLAPGGYYQLFGFDLLPAAERPPDRQERGLDENEIAERFAPQLAVIEIIRAEPDRHPCRWYLLQKRTQP